MFRFIKKNKHGMLISELCRLFTVKKLLIGILLTSGIASPVNKSIAARRDTVPKRLYS